MEEKEEEKTEEQEETEDKTEEATEEKPKRKFYDSRLFLPVITYYSQTSVICRPLLSAVFSPKLYSSQVPRIVAVRLYQWYSINYKSQTSIIRGF